LSYEYTFNYDDDTIYFAYSFPYTYSDLNEFLDKIEDDPAKCRMIHRKACCKTLAQNNCDVVTITSNTMNVITYYYYFFLLCTVNKFQKNNNFYIM
jgi:hypothetical protein